MEKNGLNKNHEAFCQEFLLSGNASDAYRKAYSTKGKSSKSINECASRLHAMVKISARIKELQAAAQAIAKKKFEVDSEEIIRHLEILRRARIDEYVEYKTVETPVNKTSTITVGSGKNKVTTTNIETFIKVETMMVFKPWDDLTEEQKMAIESVKQDRYGNIELKLHGKQWSIDMLNKHLGLYKEDNHQKKAENTVEIDMSKMTTETLQAIAEAYVKPEE